SVKGRQAGSGTVAGALWRGAAAWAQEHLRLILGCVVIFGIGLGFGLAFAEADSAHDPRRRRRIVVALRIACISPIRGVRQPEGRSTVGGMPELMLPRLIERAATDVDGSLTGVV